MRHFPVAAACGGPGVWAAAALCGRVPSCSLRVRRMFALVSSSSSEDRQIDPVGILIPTAAYRVGDESAGLQC